MASAGGTWVKATNGYFAGKMVFVPAAKPGETTAHKWNSATGKYEPAGTIKGTVQGGLLVGKTLNGDWAVYHTGTGGLVSYGYKTKAGAMAAMEEMNYSGINWKKSAEGINAEFPHTLASVTGPIKSKFGSAGPESVKTTHKTPKEMQEYQKKVDAQNKKDFSPAALKKQQKKAEAEAAAKAKTEAKAAKLAAKENAALVKAEAKAAKAQAKADKAEFETAEKTEVSYTNAVGNTVKAQGVAVEGTNYVVVKGKGAKGADEYFLLDKATGKPITGLHKTLASAKDTAKKQHLADQDNVTAENFAAKSKEVNITTVMGKQQTAQGVEIANGKFSITHNKNTGEYHLNDAVSGKTISKHKSPEDAVKSVKAAEQKMAEAAKAKAESLADTKALLEQSHTKDVEAAIFASHSKGNYSDISESQADALYSSAYKKAGYTSEQLSAVSDYQDGSYGGINAFLWGDGITSSGYASVANNLTKAIAKSPPLQHNTVVYRGKSSGSHLHNFAKAAKVGDVHLAQGHESTSIDKSFAQSWGHGGVLCKYNVPAGIKGVFMNTLGKAGVGYHSMHPSEREWLMDRGIRWKIVSKTVSNSGLINLEFEFDGFINNP